MLESPTNDIVFFSSLSEQTESFLFLAGLRLGFAGVGDAQQIKLSTRACRASLFHNLAKRFPLPFGGVVANIDSFIHTYELTINFALLLHAETSMMTVDSFLVENEAENRNHVGPRLTYRPKLATGISSDSDTAQQCEGERIHLPGTIQGFGLLVALVHTDKIRILPVRVVSENSEKVFGKSPRQLFALQSFTDILLEDEAVHFFEHVDLAIEAGVDITASGPDVFVLHFEIDKGRSKKLWCAMHQNQANPHLIVCEFEVENDPLYPLIPQHESKAKAPVDQLGVSPSSKISYETTRNRIRRRVTSNAREHKSNEPTMDVLNTMSRVEEQLATASNLETLFQVLVDMVKSLTSFHQVMVYQFDQSANGQVVAEVVDPCTVKATYKGLSFPASDIPKQARELYRINRVQVLYDCDLETAQLIYRTAEDLEHPLDLTYSYLRAMSAIHPEYLKNIAVRSSMSISINGPSDLWGLLVCHSYGQHGMRVSFPNRKICQLVGDAASRNIERLSNESRLQAWNVISKACTKNNIGEFEATSAEDLLKLFQADFGILHTEEQTKVLGHIERPQEALLILEYLKAHTVFSVTASIDIIQDFPNINYRHGFKCTAGMLIVPLSAGGSDFVVFFRNAQSMEVRWAGNPYRKKLRDTEGQLEPRKNFEAWSETVAQKCNRWSEEEVETAMVLCVVSKKCFEVWKEKEVKAHRDRLTRLLLANSAHDVRTALNAVFNYLEIAMEDRLDSEIQKNLTRSYCASRSLVSIIHELFDLGER